MTNSCSAYYCFEEMSGSHSPGMSYVTVPRYRHSSEYGSPPFYPCSSDGYASAGENACDEMIIPPSFIDPCPPIVYIPVVFKR